MKSFNENLLKNTDRKIMKITRLVIFFLSIGMGVTSANAIYSQSTYLSVEVNNKTVREVLDQIEQNSEYVFFYYDDVLDVNRKVSVRAKNKTVDKILDQLFELTDNTYVIDDRQIFISQKEVAVKLKEMAIQQQSKTITGIVRDETKESLTGVNIRIKGTTEGTVTNADGEFSISTSQINPILLISYIGYKTQEFPVGNQRHIDISLLPDEFALEDVVVVGYAVQKKVNLSGAVQAVSGKSLESRPIANVNRGLQGLVPNLNITNKSGRADNAPAINIRGFTSINGGEAFILVDNVPVTSEELSRLNPDDIASISVLKDASSAAIYGARAAFGVVLVTTKKASGEDLKISFSGNVAVRDRGIRPEIITDILEMMELKNLARTPLSPVFSEAQLDYARQLKADPSLPRVILNPNNANAWDYYGETDWINEAYRSSAPAYTSNINISRKTDNFSFYISGGFYQEDGLLRYGNDQLRRFNFRANADMKLTKWWTLGTNISYVNSHYDSPTFLDGYFNWNVNRTASNTVPRNPDGTWTSAGASVLGALESGGRRDDRKNETQLQFTTKFDLVKDVWTVNADANFRRYNFNRDQSNLTVPYRTGPDQPIQSSLGERGGDIGGTVCAMLRVQERKYDVYNLYTNFVKTFNDKHFVNAMVGYNRELTNDKVYVNKKDGLISQNLPQMNLATGQATISNTLRELALEGYFGRLNYIYDNRYIIEVNGRYDGSSRFPRGDRYGFFPSYSAAWLLSNEGFFRNISETLQISNLKFRGSYGSLGNQIVKDGNAELFYPYIPQMTSGTIAQILDGSRPIAVYQPSVASSSLTWEKVRTINGGIDLSLFGGKFDLSFDVYTRYTDDMLTYSKELPAVFGASAPKTNAADLKTKGWELTLGYRDQFKLMDSPFNWSFKFMLADSRSWITKFDNPTKLLSNYYEGQRIGEIWGFVSDGFFQSEAELAALDQTAVGTDDQNYKFYVGDVKFKDLNGDNKIDFGDRTVDNPGDRKIIGNSEMRLPYSFELTADWKGFDLRAFFQGVGKRDWYPSAASIYFWGVYAQPWTNPTKKNRDHWTPENPNGYFPRMKAYIAEDNNEELGAPQTKYLQDASYLRLKNLTVGYSLPKSVLNKLNVEYLRFYFSAENVFTFSGLDKGIDLDPEIVNASYNGFNSGTYPMQRTYSVGVNLTF